MSSSTLDKDVHDVDEKPVAPLVPTVGFDDSVIINKSRPYPHRMNQQGNNQFLPRTSTRGSTAAATAAVNTSGARIPMEFRTLSIQVYDSQHHSLHASRTKTRDGKSGADQNNDNSDSSDFFASLDFQSLEDWAIARRFNTSLETGLDNEAAKSRLSHNGPNVLSPRKSNYAIKLFWYFFGGFSSILWVGVITFFLAWKPLGSPPAAYNLALAVVVSLVICLNAAFSAFQDWSTQRVMHSILDLLPAEAVVIRDGKATTINSRDLVVGDVVRLSTGNKVPADIRLVEASSDLRFDRSVLTGESEEIPGTAEPTKETNFLESKNVALLGTHVRNGTATGVVVLTGASTAMGRINKLTNDTKDKPTLIQQEISRFVKIIVCLTVLLVAIMAIFYGAYLRKAHPAYLSVSGILSDLMGLVVAFIPEGMPIAVALTLNLIAKRMKAVDVLPKSLTTVETLGCVTVICSDKTGTLTENRMSVVATGNVDGEWQLDSDVAVGELARAMTLCNDAFIEEETQKVNGNATDGAMFRFAAGRLDVEVTRATRPRIAGIPFNSRNKYMVTVTAGKDDTTAWVKGGPDVLIKHCTKATQRDGSVQALTLEARDAVVALQEKWSRQGRRVLLLAGKTFAASSAPTAEDSLNDDRLEELALNDLTLLGLVAIMDPPRPEIPHTVSECRRAGSRFFMVTGDHRLTAAAIGQQVGILRGEREPRCIANMRQDVKAGSDASGWLQGGLVIDGTELDQLDDDDWDIICRYEEIVFARTTPEQKLRIVREFQSHLEIVAVTGDGVNDAAALKAADVGVAMVDGSDVAIEAADLVLLGSFASIVEGIRLGRLSFVNLQKCISYLLPAGSWSEDWPVIFNVFFGLPLPLSAFLMIIICCFTDLACVLTLIFEKEEFDLLSLPPRNARKDHLITFRLYGQAYLFIGVLETLCAHACYFIYYWRYAGIPLHSLFFAFENYTEGFYGYSQAELTRFNSVGQSVYFITLVIIQLGNLLSIRNKRQSIVQADPFTRPERRNLWILVGPAVALIIAVFVINVPGIQNLFGTAAIPWEFYLIPIPMAVGVLAMDELRKVGVRMWPRGVLARIAW